MENVVTRRTLQALVWFAGIAALVGSLGPAAAQAQSIDSIADLAARINRERTTRGMIPYALSASLSTAAQAHADDISRTGVNSHTGSDGSDVRERVARAGYGAYSWGRRVGENWAWYADAGTAMNMWMNSEPHNHNILHPVYREFGIGIAPGKPGTFIFVVDFGAQPNVLPIFIQTDERDGSPFHVSLVLSNETYASGGDGANTIGLATQIEISSSSDFSGAQWQTFAPRFDWTLSNGSRSVFVRYRDARGRVVTSSDSISLGASVLASVPKPNATSTPRPRATATRTVWPIFAAVAQTTETVSPSEMVALDQPVAADVQLPLVAAPAPLPPDSAESLDPLIDNRVSLLGVALFGVGTLLGAVAAVKFVRSRAKAGASRD